MSSRLKVDGQAKPYLSAPCRAWLSCMYVRIRDVVSHAPVRTGAATVTLFYSLSLLCERRDLPYLWSCCANDELEGPRHRELRVVCSRWVLIWIGAVARRAPRTGSS